jgi:hypothetical protein
VKAAYELGKQQQLLQQQLLMQQQQKQEEEEEEEEGTGRPQVDAPDIYEPTSSLSSLSSGGLRNALQGAAVTSTGMLTHADVC